jgi:hypothetical protein
MTDPCGADKRKRAVNRDNSHGRKGLCKRTGIPPARNGAYADGNPGIPHKKLFDMGEDSVKIRGF